MILIVGGVEAMTYTLGRLEIWEAVILTPLVPILITFVLFIDLEAAHLRVPWTSRESEFKKSSLMVLGGALATIGLATGLAAVSMSLDRVVIDLGAGTSLICAGVYLTKRFAF